MAGHRKKKLHPTMVRRRPPLFELTAGVLCLDFVNTLDNRPSGEPKELLARYGDLLRFAEDTGILTPAQTDRLLAWSEADPDEAQRVVQPAVELREAMHAVFFSCDCEACCSRVGPCSAEWICSASRSTRQSDACQRRFCLAV